MGSLCGGNTQTSTSQQTTTPVNQAALQSIFGQVQSAAQTPFTPYSGEMVAPVNQQQSTGIANVNAGANAAQPFYNQAAGYATTAGSPITQGAIQNNMNPFTQSVIDATQANFDESNGQQQQQIKGNAALSGALGGDRQAVAQSETARQQQLAQAPVIASLQSDAYKQAVAAAQADRSAAGNAATTFGNLGTGAQTADLQGAGAQINAGTLEQQTQQQKDQAAFQQYLQQQAFPYQNAQFLAQYGTPTALAQGSSSSGTQTAPGPNPWVQAAGLGLSAAAAFSDERIKEGKEVIGKTFDGQPIYKFRYKGNPMTQIGLMAQDVEHSHPDAVGEVGGLKTVNYDDATADAANKGRFAAGGPVSPFDFINNSPNYIHGAPGYIPQGGSAPSVSLPQSQLKFATPQQDDMKPITTALSGMKGMFGGAAYGGGNALTDSYGGSSSNPLEGLSASDYGPGFEAGGLVHAIHAIHHSIKSSRGGAVGGSPFQVYARGGTIRRFADGGGATFDDRFSAAFPMATSPAIGPVQDEPFRLAGPEAMDAWRRGVDNPNPAIVADADTPPIAPSAAAGPFNPMRNAALPPQITGAPQDDSEPTSALAYDAANPMKSAASAVAPDATTAGTMGGFNPLNLSDKLRQSLIAGGLGVAASRSPFALSAIGQGGLTGLSSYNQATAAEQAAAEKQLTHDEAAKRILLQMDQQKQQAAQFAKTDDRAERKFKADQENGKFVPAGSIVSGDTIHPAVMDQRTGKIIDAVTGKTPTPDDKIEVKGTKAPISDEDAKDIAKRYVETGDRTHLQGLGMTGSNKAKVNHFITEVQKEQGISNQDLGTRVAEWEGRKAGQRTLGTQEAKMGSAAFEAEGAIKQARGVIERLPRTSFLPINKLIEGYQNNTLNPDQTELYGRTQAIVNTYAAVMARGANVTTDSSRHHAQELLKTAGDPATYNRMLDTMLQEIDMAKKSPERMRQFYREQYGSKALGSAESQPGGGGPSTAVPKTETKIIGNKTYVKRGDQWFEQ